MTIANILACHLVNNSTFTNIIEVNEVRQRLLFDMSNFEVALPSDTCDSVRLSRCELTSE